MHVISEILCNWYAIHKRDLPWRHVNDPYLIWISEIILQQTRVNQGLDYYMRFIERFPTLKILADANEDDVLKYWQGLGYYSRARNIHKAAKQIVNEHAAIFPADYTEIIKLAGIGPYTAAAISSFAYNKAFAVVDGNVYRVLSRLFGIDTAIDSGEGIKQFAQLAQELLDIDNPAIHNQAIMEFGALHCVPVAPNCEFCALNIQCKAYEQGTVNQLPIKKQKVKVKDRYFNYFFFNLNDKTFLQKREQSDIWQNLYEFPLIEADKLYSVDELFGIECFINMVDDIDSLEIFNVSGAVKHILTHRRIYAQFISVNISDKSNYLNKCIEVSLNEIDGYAVSRLMEIFLDNN